MPQQRNANKKNNQTPARRKRRVRQFDPRSRRWIWVWA